MKNKTLFLVWIICNCIILLPHQSHAQSIGIGAGIAGVENFDFPEMNMGFSFNLPVTERVDCNISCCRWQGQDQNYVFAMNNNIQSEALYFGNTGFDLIFYYRLITIQKFSFSPGAGIGLYKMRETTSLNDMRDYYLSTFVLSGISRYKIASHLILFGKLDVCFEENVIGPNWGILTCGFEFSPF